MLALHTPPCTLGCGRPPLPFRRSEPYVLERGAPGSGGCAASSPGDLSHALKGVRRRVDGRHQVERRIYTADEHSQEPCITGDTLRLSHCHMTREDMATLQKARGRPSPPWERGKAACCAWKLAIIWALWELG